MFEKSYQEIWKQIFQLKTTDEAKKKALKDIKDELAVAWTLFDKDKTDTVALIDEYQERWGKDQPETNDQQHKVQKAFAPITEKIKGLIKQVDLIYKLTIRSTDFIEKELDVKSISTWDSRTINKNKRELDDCRKDVVEQLRLANYFFRQIVWLQEHFPDAKLRDVEGLVKLVTQKEIEKSDWSLSPGRYVGVAPPPSEDEDEIAERLRGIHIELDDLNKEAQVLAQSIQENFEELGI